MQQLAGVADLELADRVGVVQPAQVGEQLLVRRVLKPALGGEHVNRDRDDEILVRVAKWRGAIIRRLGDVIVLMPPLAIAEARSAASLVITAAAISEVTSARLRAAA